MNIVGSFQCQDKWCSLLLLWPQIWLFYLFFLITESKEVGHGWFTFCKSMLIVLNYLLFQAARICFKGTYYMVFQGPEKKITSFSLDFEDCFKDGCNIRLSPVPVTCPNFLDFLDRWSALQRLSQPSDVPLRYHGLVWHKLSQGILDSDLIHCW